MIGGGSISQVFLIIPGPIYGGQVSTRQLTGETLERFLATAACAIFLLPLIIGIDFVERFQILEVDIT